jgi:hypothetical protein
MAMEWIDANVQLPKESERVLLYTPYQVFGEDHACVGNFESISSCTTKIGRKSVRIFTHWMPLPGRP